MDYDIDNIGFSNPLEDAELNDISRVSQEINNKKMMERLRQASINNIKLSENRDRSKESEAEYIKYLEGKAKRESNKITMDREDGSTLESKELPSYFDYMKIIPNDVSTDTKSILSKASEATELNDNRTPPLTYLDFSKSLPMISEVSSIRFNGKILDSGSEDLNKYIPIWEDMMKDRIETEISNCSLKDYDKISDYIDMKNRLNFHDFCTSNNLVEMTVLSEFRNSINGIRVNRSESNTEDNYKISEIKIEDLIEDYENRIQIAMDQSTDTRLLRAKLDKLIEVRDSMNIPENLMDIIDNIKLDKDDPINYTLSFDNYKDKRIDLLLRSYPNNKRLIILRSMTGDRIINMYKSIHPELARTNQEILDHFITTGEIIDKL
jgi:hypothetical protein